MKKEEQRTKNEVNQRFTVHPLADLRSELSCFKKFKFLYIHPSARPSARPPACPPVHPSARLPIRPFAWQSVNQADPPATRPSVSLPCLPSVSPSVSPGLKSVSPSV